MNRKRGFSLVEVMVALSVLMIFMVAFTAGTTTFIRLVTTANADAKTTSDQDTAMSVIRAQTRYASGFAVSADGATMTALVPAYALTGWGGDNRCVAVRFAPNDGSATSGSLRMATWATSGNGDSRSGSALSWRVLTRPSVHKPLPADGGAAPASIFSGGGASAQVAWNEGNDVNNTSITRMLTAANYSADSTVGCSVS
jgi:prepilin-type N-terminal cleavage/methylation domain-containing protein